MIQPFVAEVAQGGALGADGIEIEVGDMTTPFGGFKQSGFGRDKSLHAMDKYTELKTTYVQLS